jgi:hypothetical protein
MDCVGSTSCDVAHSDAAAADMMIVVMGDSNRAEHMHGDYLLWAMRLEDTVRTIFVLPKFDEIFKQGRYRYAAEWPKCSLTKKPAPLHHDTLPLQKELLNYILPHPLIYMYADQWQKR